MACARKFTLLTGIVLVTFSLLIGCGGEADPASNASAAAEPEQTEATPAPKNAPKKRKRVRGIGALAPKSGAAPKTDEVKKPGKKHGIMGAALYLQGTKGVKPKATKKSGKGKSKKDRRTKNKPKRDRTKKKRNRRR